MKRWSREHEKGWETQLSSAVASCGHDLPALWAQQHDLEYEIHADDPMPGAISSFAYMRGVLAGMGYAQKTAA